MDLLSAGDGGSRSWHSLLWHQWVAALRAEAAVLAHDPRRSPPPRRSKSARRSQVGPRPASGNRTPGRPADCAPSGRLRTPRDRCRDLPGSAARRTWRISSSSEAISANDGHAAITRPAWLGHGHIGRQAGDAARDQTCPRQCSTFASRPRIGPGAWSTQRRSSRPPTAASGRQPSLAARATPPAQVHMKVGDCASDQRQQSKASDRCPPDPPVRAGGHDRLPTGNSPVSTHWFWVHIPLGHA